MTQRRSLVVNIDEARCYHFCSRCVRQDPLCGIMPNGKDCSYRRVFIEEELDRCAAIYAVHVISYNVLDNHFHVVSQFRPDLADRWSPLEVAQRSLKLMPKATFPEARRLKAQAEGELSTEQLAQALSRNKPWVKKQRRRLKDPSWFMKSVKETIARRVNKEEKKTGAFWEGRFKCTVLLDPPAALGCSIYVDLNQIRAGMTSRLEECMCSSIRQRLLARQRNSEKGQPPESGLWLRPLELPEDATGPAVQLGVTLEQYIQLVEATGRQIRAGCGRIDPELEPILQRLELKPSRWTSVMKQAHRFRGTAMGSTEQRRREAARRKTKWVVGRSGVHQN